MDEGSGEILNHIEQQRERLGRNLDELEDKVRSTTDWRTHFDKNPMLAMGVALGGGMLLSAVMRGRSSPARSQSRSWPQDRRLSSAVPSPANPGAGTVYQMNKVSETVNTIRGALFGFAAAKVKTLLAEALPGFEKHLKETEETNSGRRLSNPGSAPPPSGAEL